MVSMVYSSVQKINIPIVIKEYIFIDEDDDNKEIKKLLYHHHHHHHLLLLYSKIMINILKC